jgi:Flp pilus assembly protein TadB
MLFIVNPGYIGILLEDPLGKLLVPFALFLMGTGMIAIRKMIDVKV